ncbi:MAG: ATP synthase subunit I [Thermodesulfobacteriota bacterium]|nr:ATP synthase subunit I [Thermodesulfobacteriota bacterium]
MQKLSWILLLIMTVAGWLTFSPLIAKSIFVGGLISNICFKWLEKDLTGLFNGSAKPAKIKFIFRYYLRFAIVVAVLCCIIKFQMVHTVGLVLGLSTVIIGIGITAIAEAKKTGLMIT